VIDFVKQYERERGYAAHPIGMTMQYPVPDQTKANEPLFNSPADWVSPGFDEPIVLAPHSQGPAPGRWYTNPPANDGAKVVIADTDHFAPGQGDALWAWKSFLRGQHPSLMDFGLISGARPSAPAPGTPPFEAYESARYAMGDTLRYAQKMQLIETEPRGDLSSTGYALVNPGKEYLVLQPGETAEPFTLAVTAGAYATEWYSVTSRESAKAEKVMVEPDGRVSFKAPFADAGPAVLYLRSDDLPAASD
jgi:hypothetical protein